MVKAGTKGAKDMAKATDMLMDEHRGIERMLGAMERAISRLQAGDATAVPMFAQGVDFLRGFADRCHHYKEEQHLFPMLATKGVAVATPVSELLGEHEKGRGLIRAMDESVQRAQAGEKAALKDLAAATSSYIQLLRAHIVKEDAVLQTADRTLAPADQKSLAETFERVEVEIMGVGTHERYHQMLDSLEG